MRRRAHALPGADGAGPERGGAGRAAGVVAAAQDGPGAGPPGTALRARIVLRAAEGLSNTAIAAELGVAKHTVGKWRERFARDRLEGLRDEPPE